jgi:hypothetical protein
MSQTETLLLFVLGFCVALFVVLLLGRGVWSVVGNWNSWREQRRQPAAVRELQAERDSLKAEKAIMAQKLEASLNDMKMRMAEQMAEVSRSRNRLLDMGTTLKERENTISHQAALAEERNAKVAALEIQIEENVKAINLAYAKMAQREDEHGKMQGVLKDAQSTLLMRDEKIRNLADETRALRDIATLSAPTVHRTEFLAPYLASTADPKPATNGNPFADDNTFAPAPAEKPLTEAESDERVDRSVSNVLSLAERVRGLQTGMKKA